MDELFIVKYESFPKRSFILSFVAVFVLFCGSGNYKKRNVVQLLKLFSKKLGRPQIDAISFEDSAFPFHWSLQVTRLLWPLSVILTPSARLGAIGRAAICGLCKRQAAASLYDVPKIFEWAGNLMWEEWEGVCVPMGSHL